MQLCISNIVLCARLPREVRAAASGKARKSINVYALHFLHLSHGHPAVPSQHNAVESRQWIDKDGRNEKPARKANMHMLPSVSNGGGGDDLILPLMTKGH